MCGLVHCASSFLLYFPYLLSPSFKENSRSNPLYETVKREVEESPNPECSASTLLLGNVYGTLGGLWNIVWKPLDLKLPQVPPGAKVLPSDHMPGLPLNPGCVILFQTRPFSVSILFHLGPSKTPFLKQQLCLSHSQLNVLCTCHWGISYYLGRLYVIKHKADQVNWNCYFWNWNYYFFN